ncbi:MAG TPA: PEP-CTERM sorting domain-containing protein [Bryobacteraceae bacterium]|jgi:hypothetical protein
MKTFLLLCSASTLLSCLCSAAAFTTGTPNDFGSGLSPIFGTPVNFDGLTPNTVLASGAFSSVGVTSIVDDGGSTPLNVLPFSSMSGPNEIGTAGPTYAGDILITLSAPTNEIGIGIASDGSTSVTLKATTVGGVVTTETISSVSATPLGNFDGYYVFSDPSFDLASLEIISSQNLAIDDLQFAPTPEPASLTLLGAGAGLLGLAGLRRKKA